ncbi:hypothetical protein LMORI2_22390 [Limnohabitans sp. MORI2]|jgi:predicted Fe-S protein YdhL (DUF1289 family)|uniref:DUF1289 domain-containing protein n=1 Tax=Limnohabitans sp. MORI2 TaxID=1751150 RepID=UPI00237706D0|nr:DUF1289 domain-containing protein [Limnohabitans sp. MORI2]BDU59257.1 hypothetical protein LMORI2_22390 [Limnohabitans sp. MORI2]
MCGSELTPKPQGLTPSDLRLQAQAKRVLQSADAPPSPCISVCRMSDDTTYCEGCWRSLDEIAGWAQRNPDEKRAVWQQIEERLETHA